MAIVNFHLSHAFNISAKSEKQLSTINLSQVCIYTNAAFLAAADSKRFVMFIVLLMATLLYYVLSFLVKDDFAEVTLT